MPGPPMINLDGIAIEEADIDIIRLLCEVNDDTDNGAIVIGDKGLQDALVKGEFIVVNEEGYAWGTLKLKCWLSWIVSSFEADCY